MYLVLLGIVHLMIVTVVPLGALGPSIGAEAGYDAFLQDQLTEVVYAVVLVGCIISILLVLRNAFTIVHLYLSINLDHLVGEKKKVLNYVLMVLVPAAYLGVSFYTNPDSVAARLREPGTILTGHHLIV